MPALRKRLSRTSTPYDTPNDTPPHDPEPRKGKQQSSLDGWIEPPLKNPTASFEEAGFARHGLFDSMAPLGQGPSARVKQRVRAMGEAFSRGALGKKSNLLSGEEGASTPEMTPAPELEQEDSEMVDDDELLVPFAPADEDEDEEYVPKKSKAKASVAKTPIRGKTPVNNKTPIQGKTPLRNGTSRTPSVVASPAVQNNLAPPFDPVTLQRTQIAVNAAIDRSNTAGRRNIGRAIRDLWIESTHDLSLAEVLQSIMHQTASTEQFTQFRNFIKGSKRNQKKEARQQAREEQDARESKEAQAASEAAKTAADSPPSHSNGDFAIPTGPSTTKFSGKPHLEPGAHITSQTKNSVIHSRDEDVPHVEVSSIEPTPAPVVLHPLNAASTLPASAPSSPPAVEMSSKSPRKQKAMTNGDAIPNSALSTNAHTPAPKTPVSADSDLSDVDEEIVQNGPPEPAQVNGHATAPLPKKAKNAALARAGKKSRANSVKPPGKYEKKPPPSADEVAEQLRLQRKRQEMVDQQPTLRESALPVSDVRFDDEMLETESLTDSQIAVGPPVDNDQPRRPGRVPRNTNGMSVVTGKRLRDGSSAQPSPLLESAASTRPTTPAIAAPFPKRLKLNNGQAARTKRSPVKNRDGPIAGIPHHGGGGSRQSGPDDNGPGSPPSESDDLCSACKGAGQFVCCDHCPRVFHFDCCDPPHNEAPTGSFSCFQCAAQHKPADEPTGSYSCFGPLFKQLESINPRAFALPPDVQNFYEGVSARPDGSYFEDVKKFPLSKNSGYGYQKPDYVKTTDTDHKAILCTQCGKSSGGKRQMLKCDFCNTYWHLDCCSPPLANPPHISLDAAQRDAWKCPRHTDHDLRSGLLLQHDLNEGYDDDVAMVDATPVVRVARKVRKPKNAEVIEPTFSRGMRNNGLVVITNDPDDETDGEGNYVFADENPRDLNSKLFRVSEKGVVLDFISKVKEGRIQKQKEAKRLAKAAAKRRSSAMMFAARPIQQQQAALNLARLANKEQDIGLNDHSVDALVLSLTAEMPTDVVTAIDNAGPPQAISQRERDELLKLQKLINRRLAAFK